MNDTYTQLRTLDEQIRALYKQRRPLTQAARLRTLSEDERSSLDSIDRRIDELEIEEDRVARAATA